MAGIMTLPQLLTRVIPPPVATWLEPEPPIPGSEAVDDLLRELGSGETDAADAALDLRLALAGRSDAGACLETFLRLRGLLDGRHALAFFLVCHCLRRSVSAQVRATRGAAWETRALPVDAARFEEVVNGCLASVAIGGEFPPRAEVRFVFAG